MSLEYCEGEGIWGELLMRLDSVGRNGEEFEEG